MKKANFIISIALYVIAGFLVIYAIWAFSHNVDYIGGLISSGELTFAGNEYDIMNFYMSSCAQYAVYAIVLFALGWMMQKKESSKSDNATNLHTGDVKKDDGELDEWFQGEKEAEDSADMSREID
jgi:hypothetical protein